MMKRFLIFVFLILFLVIVIAGFVSHKFYEKIVFLENYSNYENSIHKNDSFVENKLTQQQISVKRERQIEEVNSSVSSSETNLLNTENLNSLTDKAKKENHIYKEILKKWNKPFNYKDGYSCNFDICYGKNKKIAYDIKDCNSDAIFKRSVSLAIESYFENVNPSQYAKYNCKSYETTLSIYFVINND